MPEIRVCATCPNKLSIYNKKPTCNACQSKAAVKKTLNDMPVKPSPARLVEKREKPAPLPPPPPPAVPEVDGQKGTRLDSLKSETVDLDAIPAETMHQRKSAGRLAELWDKIRENPPGKAEKVENRDRDHATQTLTHMRKKAKKAGRTLNERRVGSVCYVWLDPIELSKEDA